MCGERGRVEEGESELQYRSGYFSLDQTLFHTNVRPTSQISQSELKRNYSI